MLDFDKFYNETVPFVDYMPFNIDDDKTYKTQKNDPVNDIDPHADIKGKKLTPYGHLNRKNLTGMIKESPAISYELKDHKTETVAVLFDEVRKERDTISMKA